ncbi:hypothetical protein BASA61_006877 [Batrachochytrium salamandrivorans]|nr:hypothetical protein BASA60_010343 [Batrachochytrium salamandrivorans]KAH6570849.1 hypothetical protein BASA62_004135 [Batrachochytrium salamandrivorans]KAH6585381.1 hypothetical protein BASA61_006877 [Batrachochytrium salamandrivorans]KAH9245460.1 hypothetical protein BASA81_017059 [Batrachochytrium salamandrivorans]
MQSIKRRLYEADDDQAAVVMARLDEASQRSLQPLSNPALATKRGRPAGSTKRKASQREKSLFENVRDVVRLVTILAHAMCKHLSNNNPL